MYYTGHSRDIFLRQGNFLPRFLTSAARVPRVATAPLKTRLNNQLLGTSLSSSFGSLSLDSSVVQGERGRDLGEVAEPLLEINAGSSSSLESVLAGGVAIWLGDLVLPCEDPFRFFLDLGRIESEERLRGLGGVTSPCPLGLADPFMDRWPSCC